MSIVLDGTSGITTNSGTVVSTTDATLNGLTVGKGAGAVSTNTAVGASALQANSTGANNTAVGVSSLFANTSGGLNSAFGRLALATNTTGNDNSAFGHTALYLNTTGSSNTGLGRDALRSNTTASNNTAVGYQAGYSNTTGTRNAFYGMYSGYGITTGTDNTALGYNAIAGGVTVTGSYNTAIGVQSLYNNTTATNNTAVGYQAGYTNSTGGNGTFLGYQAGYTSNNAGQTIIGMQAGYSVTGGYNTFVGQQAGYVATTGTNQTFVGGGAGSAITTGSKNSIFGAYTGNQGGLDIRTASNYIVLSDGDGNPRGIFNGSGRFLINNQAIYSDEWISLAASSSQQFAYWRSSSTSGNPTMFRMSTGIAGGAIGSGNYIYCEDGGSAKFYVVGGGSIYSTNTSISAISDQRLKENVRDLETGLSEVMALKPRRFDWKEGEGTGEKNVAGFIAQEVETVLSDLVGEWKRSLEEETIYKSLAMGNMIPTLVKSIQELKALVDAQATEIAELKAKVA